ncbi:MAG: RluA family pseudouridine synthase [Bermanella sp.]
MDALFKSQIDIKNDGMTLLQYLVPSIPYLAEEQWLSLLKGGAIEIDGQVVHEDVVLTAGQHLQYTIANYEEGPVNTHWQLLWESEDIIAIHKPANLPVSRTTRNVYNTLIQLVRRESTWPDAHLLHRLDLETSGIILLSKDKAGASQWQPRLKELIEQKIYHAVVYGHPDWLETELQCKLNTRQDSPIRCQMHVCQEDEKGKASHTRFKVLNSGANYTLLECELLSGRKHQIRAHLAHLGHPIVGDKIYANDGTFYLNRLQDAVTDEDMKKLQTPHHLLHAYQLKISIPNNPSHILTNSGYPKEFQKFCQSAGLMIEANIKV